MSSVYMLNLGPRRLLGRNENLLWLKIASKKCLCGANISHICLFIEPYKTHQTSEGRIWRMESFPFITRHNPPAKFNISLSLSNKLSDQVCYESSYMYIYLHQTLNLKDCWHPHHPQHLPFGPECPLKDSRLMFKRMINLK